MFLVNVVQSPNFTVLQPEDRTADSHSRKNLSHQPTVKVKYTFGHVARSH
jgi:hypothetical protein